MSLEELIGTLTTSIDRLNANLESGKTPGGAAATTAGKGKDKAAKAAAVTTFTAKQVSDALLDVKAKIDGPSAKAIIEEHGGAGAKMAEVCAKPELFDAIMASCAEALEEAGAGGDGEDL